MGTRMHTERIQAQAQAKEVGMTRFTRRRFVRNAAVAGAAVGAAALGSAAVAGPASKGGVALPRMHQDGPIETVFSHIWGTPPGEEAAANKHPVEQVIE